MRGLRKHVHHAEMGKLITLLANDRRIAHQACWLAGDIDQAEADFREAIDRKHSPIATKNQLAWVLTTRGDVSERDIGAAVRLARQSVAERRGADNLNTL